jgi:hypothetical protein
MIAGKTLPDLARELERQRANTKDFIVNTRKLQMIGDAVPVLSAGGQSFGIRQTAHEHLTDLTGIPKKYYDRMKAEAPQLLADNVNHWFQARGTPQMVRTLDGGARALLSDKYRRIDNWQIASAALPVLSEIPGLKVISSEITERRMYLFAATDRIQGDVKVGDVVQMGLRISNSEVGYGMISVAPTLLRLRCLNGMTIDEGAMKSRHVGKRLGNGDDDLRELFSTETKEAEDRALMLKIRDLVKLTMTETFFEKQLTKMQVAAGNLLQGDPLKAVEEVQELVGLTQEEGSGVLRHLISGGDLSQWGVLNAVTALANDSKDYDRATELMTAGGDILMLPQRDWARIAEAGKN